MMAQSNNCTLTKQDRHYQDTFLSTSEITKILLALSKIKGNEIISEWITPCTNHFYWSATTTIDGDGRVILAKFMVFLNHVTNVHEHLQNPLFNKCDHGKNVRPKKWIPIGEFPLLCISLFISVDFNMFQFTSVYFKYSENLQNRTFFKTPWGGLFRNGTGKQETSVNLEETLMSFTGN